MRGTWRSAAPAVLMAAWGGNHFSPLLLMYRQVDGYTAVQVDLFFAFYVLGLIPGFLVSGPLSDRHGRRRSVAAALALGLVGSVILALGSANFFWMCAGRLVSGVSVAVAMVAGTSWIKELSQPDATPAVRARRASLTLTAGFGLGAGVSGALAQWAPFPTILPYAIHIVLSLAAAFPLPYVPETVIPQPRSRRVPPRYWRVAVMAPWVFAAPALAFVVAPALVAAQVTGHQVAFAALQAVIALCFGAAVQPCVPRIARWTGGRQATTGLVAIALGAALLAAFPAVLPAILTAPLFGAGYGICIVAGLVEVQAVADPSALATLTGMYYSLTYIGFALPVILAALAAVVSYSILLSGVAVLCLLCALARASAVSPPA